MKNTYHRLKEAFKNRDFNVSIYTNSTDLHVKVEQKESEPILAGCYLQRALQVVDDKYMFYVSKHGGRFSIIFHKRI